METRNLRSWAVAKNNTHDASGISAPEKWQWERVNGVFYPVEKVPEVAVIEETEEQKRMFAELDPDWSDEEMVAHGWEIKDGLEYGEDTEINFRENCGHAVAV